MKAKDFTLQASNGKDVSLSDYKGKAVILYFYPKDSTPGCTTEACDFRDNSSVIKEGNAEILGISLDSINSHEKFIEKNDDSPRNSLSSKSNSIRVPTGSPASPYITSGSAYE